ncbi:MAG: FHA domain-containing protein, partial [Planctomycetaceae bacterium]
MLRVELKVLEGSQAGKVIPLNVRQFLIGREQDCHLRPNSELVSRHHCVFAIDDFSVRLRDLGSTNGTFLNGERLKGQAVLKAGDKVTVGKLAFEVSIQLSPAAAPVEEPEAPDNTAIVDEAAQNGATIEFGAVTQADDTAMFPQGETAVPPQVSLPPGFN